METSSVVAPGFAHHSLLAILSHFILLLKSANLHTARQTPLVFCSPSASCLAKMFGSMSRQMVGNERIFKYRQQAAWHKCLNYCTDKWYAANGFFNTVSNLLGKNVWIPVQSTCGGSLCEESHRSSNTMIFLVMITSSSITPRRESRVFPRGESKGPFQVFCICPRVQGSLPLSRCAVNSYLAS